MSKRVLIVDDDKGLRTLLSTLLGLEGFEIITDFDLTKDGILKSIHSTMPDVILMDVHIKDLDGIEILKLIRSTPGFSNVHVIMSSGQNLQARCIEAGAQGFLMKPYMPNELLDLIR